VLERTSWDWEMGTDNCANVKWANGQTNKYRLGAEQSIDLICVKDGEASGSMYYPDHLPVFGRLSLACVFNYS